MKKLWLALLLIATPALAQNVPNHAVPIGMGPGAVGWRAVGPCDLNVPIVGGGLNADPVCATGSAGNIIGLAATAPLAVSLIAGIGTYSINLDANFTTSAGSLAFTNIASGSLLANGGAASAEPTATTPQTWLNRWCSTAQYNFPQATGASTWGCGTVSGLLLAGTGITLSGTGQVTVAISANGVGNGQLRQGAARSVVGNCTNIAANVADVVGTANQVLQINSAGTACSWALLSGANLNANTVANSNLAQGAAATLKGNPTAALANEQDFTIAGLTHKGAPDTTNDKMMYFDSAAGTFVWASVGEISTAATSGVTTIGGAAGVITLGYGLLQTGQVLAAPVLASATHSLLGGL